MTKYNNEASKRLAKLNIGYSKYCLFLDVNDTEVMLHFDVCGFPTTGVYHICFTKCDGNKSALIKEILEINEISFNVNSITEIEKTTSITCTDLLTNKSYTIENIKHLGIKNTDDEDSYEDFKDSINSNKELKSSMEMLTKIKSGNYASGNLKPNLLSRIFSFFK